MSFPTRLLPQRRSASLGLLVSVTTITAFLAPAGIATASGAHGFTQVNLVSDVPGLAKITDFRVSNPWGIALGAATPLWVNNNNTATSEVYAGANGVNPLTLALVVQTPAGPTGIAFNSTGAFAAHQNGSTVPTLFLFNGFDGYTSGWGPTASPITNAIPTHFVRTNGYLGMAVANTPQGPRLYAATFSGRIQVFNGNFRQLSTPHAFIDPMVPPGLAPYNVAVFGNRVYVTYANASGGPGPGAIAVFRLNGVFIRQLTADRHLVSPWGLAMAPAHWGNFGNMLLVGNVDNGRISAFDPTTGAFKGQLTDGSGHVIVNNGLWGLAFGNGQTGTPQDLLFAAGIDNYAHGLIGLIHPN
jgi:uncharacterized protein (TIGR03118 family)